MSLSPTIGTIIIQSLCRFALFLCSFGSSLFVINLLCLVVDAFGTTQGGVLWSAYFGVFFSAPGVCFFFLVDNYPSQLSQLLSIRLLFVFQSLSCVTLARGLVCGKSFYLSQGWVPWKALFGVNRYLITKKKTQMQNPDNWQKLGRNQIHL